MFLSVSVCTSPRIAIIIIIIIIIINMYHRPDACIITSKGEIYPIELTVCCEHNTTKAREYQEQRHGNLQEEIEI